MVAENARSYAESKGGYLACVTNADENLWISNAFTPGELEYVVFGGNDTQAEGSWQWVSGRVLEFRELDRRGAQ